jgi:hypothetical protein
MLWPGSDSSLTSDTPVHFDAFEAANLSERAKILYQEMAKAKQPPVDHFELMSQTITFVLQHCRPAIAQQAANEPRQSLYEASRSRQDKLADGLDLQITSMTQEQQVNITSIPLQPWRTQYMITVEPSGRKSQHHELATPSLRIVTPITHETKHTVVEPSRLRTPAPAPLVDVSMRSVAAAAEADTVDPRSLNKNYYYEAGYSWEPDSTWAGGSGSD